jgi:anti-sigma factor RsiW
MTSPEPDELALLAPFYVAGTLSAAEKAAFEAALARDPALVRNVESARAEAEETIALNEALPAPTSRATERLSALLDAEPPRRRTLLERLDLGGTLGAWLSPRALGWAASAALLLAVVEAGALLAPSPPRQSYSTASQDAAPVRAGHFALIAFAPNVSTEAVSALLAANGAQIVEGPRAGGFYRVSLGAADLPEAEAQKRLDALRLAATVIRFAEKAP